MRKAAKSTETSRSPATVDPAAGGYFVVHDKGAGQYDVCGYSAKGVLLLHTWHLTEASMEIECAVWRGRGAAEHRFGFPAAPR